MPGFFFPANTIKKPPIMAWPVLRVKCSHTVTYSLRGHKMGSFGGYMGFIALLGYRYCNTFHLSLVHEGVCVIGIEVVKPAVYIKCL